MSCSVTCLDKRYRTIKKVNLENSISLKHLVFGYKIFDKDYFDFNFIETILIKSDGCMQLICKRITKKVKCM